MGQIPDDTTDMTARVDLGGELVQSGAVWQLFLWHGHLVQPTGMDSSSQNGAAEQPHEITDEVL